MRKHPESGKMNAVSITWEQKFLDVWAPYCEETVKHKSGDQTDDYL